MNSETEQLRELIAAEIHSAGPPYTSGAGLRAVLTALAEALGATSQLDSPAFTGAPTAPTPPVDAAAPDRLATTAFVRTLLAQLPAAAFARLQGLPADNTALSQALAGKADLVAGMVSPAQLPEFVRPAALGAANGVATLDAAGKHPLAQVPDALLGQVHYQGTYLLGADRIASHDPGLNAAALPAATAATTGWYFLVQDAGTLNGKAFNPGDWLISNGAAGWDKVDNTDAVVSVAGRLGAIVLTTLDVAEDPGRQYFTPARALDTRLVGYQKDAAPAALGAGTALLGWLQQVEYRVDQRQNAETFAPLPSAASLALDFLAAGSTQLLTATGNLTITGIANPAQGRTKRLKIRNGGSTGISLSLPAWTFLGNAAPTSLAAGKQLLLSLECLDPAPASAADVTAAYAVTA